MRKHCSELPFYLIFYYNYNGICTLHINDKLVNPNWYSEYNVNRERDSYER